MKALLFNLLFFFFFVTCTRAVAQFSLGADAAFPAGSLAHNQRTGLGGDARYDGKIVSKLKWSFGVGYYSLQGKSYNFSYPYPQSGFLPTKDFLSLFIGMKYFFKEGNQSFYAGVDAGPYYNSSLKFIGVAPGIGYRFKKVDFSCRFHVLKYQNGFMNYNDYFSTLRAAYIF